MGKKAKDVKLKTSVKSYQGGIDAEKQKMSAYAKKMGSIIKSLQSEFKKHSKEMKEAGRNMVEEGNRNMSAKVGKFRGEIKEGNRNMSAKVGKFRREIKNQIRENKEAVSHMEDGVKFFLSEVNKKKKDFHAYQHGPFQGYIRAFWG